VGSPARINTRGYGLCVHACWREAILSACGRNTHGKTRTNDDTRRVVTRLLTDAEWQHWSDRESARHGGVSHDFVNKLSTPCHWPLARRAADCSLFWCPQTPSTQGEP